MKYLLSMDGGGSKTAWLLTTTAGKVVAHHITDGCSHPQMGIPAVLELIHSGIETLIKKANCSKENILSAAFGIPCYGEYPDADQIISDDLHQYLTDAIVTTYNDVELGFAGSLCLESGIHLVAGTGAIAIGRNAAGMTARSNGWHPSFSDEGSGYWLGIQTLSLFTKQADFRIPRSALYSIIHKELGLSADADIIPYFDNTLNGNRKKNAALQQLLKKAALAGDISAVRLYEAAAHELYLSIQGVYHALAFSPEDKIKISYSGGLFSEGNFLIKPLSQLVQKQLNSELIPPALSPVYGGILLAMQNISKKDAKNLCQLLKSELKEEGYQWNL